MIRVMIERHCKPGKEEELEKLSIDLRSRAMHYPGYISGETLQSAGDPTHWMVISTWISEEHWAAWQRTPNRRSVMNNVEPLLSSPEKVEIYHFTKRAISSSAHTVDR